MIDLKSTIGFDWDKGNIDKNWLKHRVSYRECEEIFYNKPILINEDQKHLSKEIRFQVLGQSNKKRKLFLIYTVRNNKIRVISARDQNKKERIAYEKA